MCWVQAAVAAYRDMAVATLVQAPPPFVETWGWMLSLSVVYPGSWYIKNSSVHSVADAGIEIPDGRYSRVELPLAEV